MRDITEIGKSIVLLSTYPEIIAWSDFGDRGTTCTGPFKLKDGDEILEDAAALALVKISMPKGSMLHLNLAGSVAKILDCKWVTYNWLSKIVGRIIACGSFQDFQNMLALSLAAKSSMKHKIFEELKFSQKETPKRNYEELKSILVEE
jgi:hypothetical protein